MYVGNRPRRVDVMEVEQPAAARRSRGSFSAFREVLLGTARISVIFVPVKCTV